MENAISADIESLKGMDPFETKNNKSMTFAAKDNDRIFIKDKKIFVDDFEFKINDSQLIVKFLNLSIPLTV